MSFQVEVRRSIGEINLSAWNRACDSSRDLLMHPAFLEAAEASMGAGTAGARAVGCDTHFWYLTAYRAGEPVGAACVTEYPVDTTVLASPLAQRVVGRVRRLFPRYLKFRATFCGLPISIAGSNLRVAETTDTHRVVSALNEAVERIARERKTWLVVYKELTHAEMELAAPLEAAGFVRAESLPMNRIINRFANLDAMLAAMRSHYRYKIVRSRRKFARSGYTLSRTTKRSEIERIYSPALHAMYEGVVRRSAHRLEVLPREFFLELAGRFPDELMLTTISQGSRPLAFAWSLRHGPIYRNLFVGIDYDFNADADPYFNLMTEDIAYGLEQSVEEIYVGQSADDFKSRLGCVADPRFLLVKVMNRWLHWCFLSMRRSFLPPPLDAPRRDVFRKEASGSPDTPSSPKIPV